MHAGLKHWRFGLLLREIDVGKPFHALMLARCGEVMQANRMLMHRRITAFCSGDRLWDV